MQHDVIVYFGFPGNKATHYRLADQGEGVSTQARLFGAPVIK